MNGFLQDLRFGVGCAPQTPRLHGRLDPDARPRRRRQRRHLQRPAGGRAARPAVSRADRIAVMWTKNIRQNLPDGSSYLNFRDWKAQSQAFEDDGRLRPAGVHARHARRQAGRRAHPGRARRARASSSCSARRRCRPDLRSRRLRRDAARGRHQPRPLAAALRRAIRGVIGRSVQLERRDRRDRRRDAAASSSCRPPTSSSGSRSSSARSGRTPAAAAPTGSIVLGRLAPSATIASARAEMDAIAARLRDQYPATNARFGVTTDPLTDRVIGRDHRALALAAVRVGRVRAADRLRQRREPRARARGRAASRVLAADGARRRHGCGWSARR